MRQAWHCGMCETTWEADNPTFCETCESDEIETRTQAVAWRGEETVAKWEQKAAIQNANRAAYQKRNAK